MSKTILVVEDSGSFRMVVKIGLEKAGYQVIEAASGEAASALLDGRVIDMVICDLNMPGMSGLDFVRHLRTTSYQHSPVIMLTTETQDDKKSQGLDIGVRAWVTKPFQPSYLIEAVHNVCPL